MKILSLAMFRVVAPIALNLRVRIGQGFDMMKGPDGKWTVTTTPVVVGFHYYSLQIDRGGGIGPIRAGKAKPMIIVMDNLNAVKPGESAAVFAARGWVPAPGDARPERGGTQAAGHAFAPVAGDPAGGQPDRGAAPVGRGNRATNLNCGGAFADPASFNRKVKVLFLGIGSAERQGTKDFSDALISPALTTSTSSLRHGRWMVDLAALLE